MYDNDFLCKIEEVPKFDGACKGMPTDWWFPEFPMTQEQSRNATKAIEICDNCHEKQRCLDYAIDNPKIAGIWGGAGWKQRQNMRRRKLRQEVNARIQAEKEKQKQIKLSMRGEKSA